MGGVWEIKGCSLPRVWGGCFPSQKAFGFFCVKVKCFGASRVITVINVGPYCFKDTIHREKLKSKIIGGP